MGCAGALTAGRGRASSGRGLLAQARLWESRLSAQTKLLCELSPPSLGWGKDWDCSIPEHGKEPGHMRRSHWSF